MEDSVHLRMQHHDFAKIYGISKINVIHRGRDDITVGVPVRRQRCRHVHQVHHLPAEQLPQRIRLRRQNDFCHLRPRRVHRLPRQLGFPALLCSCLPLHSFLHFSLRRILGFLFSARRFSGLSSPRSFPSLFLSVCSAASVLIPFFVPLCVLRGLCVNSLFSSSLCALCARRPLC